MDTTTLLIIIVVLFSVEVGTGGDAGTKQNYRRIACSAARSSTDNLT